MLDHRDAPRRDLSALLAAAMMLAGCLGKPEADPVDAGCIDCDRPVPEPEPCPGHGCGNPDPPFALSEGGEFRLERLQDSADDSGHTLAAQAFFFKGQTPPYRSFGGEQQLTLRQEIRDKGLTCLDLRGGVYFDNGKTPEAQDIADTRSYYDVGATATLTSTAEPPDVVTLDRFLRSDDPQGATDLSSGLQHAVLYKGDPAQRIRGNTTYRPSIAGTADYPVLDLTWGRSANGEEVADVETGRGTPQIYMPPAFVLTSPTEEEFFTPGFLTFTRGQDLVVTYTADAPPQDWPSILASASFVNGEGRIQVSCFKVRLGFVVVPDDGELVLPHEVLEFVDPNGRLVLGRQIHVAWEQGPDQSRLDLIGVESKRAPYTIQDAPP